VNRRSLHGPIVIVALAAGFMGASAAPRSAAVYPSGLSAGGGIETDQRQSGALSATPRSSLRHDPTAIAAPVVSAIPGISSRTPGVLRRDRVVTGNHVEATSAAPRASHTPTARATVPPPSPERPGPAGGCCCGEGGRPGLLRHRVLVLPPRSAACTVGYAADQCHDPIWRCYAAAGPAIRAALGPNWRGHIVTVETGRVAVEVRLVDWCSCPDGRLLDLYASVYGQLDSLSSGLLDVTVAIP
jgi:hypothetical protein